MQIRKNTKEHSAIFEVLKKHETDKKRNELIKIFTLKAGESLDKKRPVEEAKNLSDLYYNLNYSSILKNLLDKEHQLHKSDDDANVFYFESNYSPVETPFQLTPSIMDEVSVMVGDKKFKARAPKKLEEEFDTTEEESKPEEITEEHEKTTIKEPTTKIKKQGNKAPKKGEPKEVLKVDFQLQHDIEFTNLDKVLSKEPLINKKVVLEYYNHVADLMLPFIQDHPLFEEQLEEILGNTTDKPDWLKTANIYSEDIEGEFIIGYDKEHILFMAEQGIVEFYAWPSHNKKLKNPTILILELNGDVAFKHVIQAGLISKETLEICELQGFPYTTGDGGLIILIPLDGQSNFDSSHNLAVLLSTLIIKKAAGKVILEDQDSKDTVNITFNTNTFGQAYEVPFSINKSTFLVNTPVTWQDLQDGIDYKNFTIDTILQKITRNEVESEEIPANIKALEVFEKLDRRYGFLL